LRLCLRNQESLTANHYVVGLFGETHSGKTTFIHNLVGKRKVVNEEETYGKPIQYYAIEKYEMELHYLSTYDERIWKYVESVPERQLESFIARWIYDQNFILKSSPSADLKERKKLSKSEDSNNDHNSLFVDPTFEKSALHSSSLDDKQCADLHADELNEEKEDESFLFIQENEIRHDIVKKYLSQQSHTKQSKLFLSFYDFSGKKIYSNFLNDFAQFSNVNIVFFDMEKLLSLTTRNETIVQLRSWINYVLLLKYSSDKKIFSKKKKRLSVNSASNAPYLNGSTAGLGGVGTMNSFSILLVGTRKDVIANKTDHMKVSNLLYEKLNDLNIWNYVLTCPYYKRDQQVCRKRAKSSPNKTNENSEEQDATEQNREANEDDDEEEEEEEDDDYAEEEEEMEKINLWFFPVDNNYHKTRYSQRMKSSSKKRKSKFLQADQDSIVKSLLHQLEDYFVLQKIQFVERKQYLNDYLSEKKRRKATKNQSLQQQQQLVPSLTMENISSLKILQIIDHCNREITNPFLTLNSFQDFLVKNKLFSKTFLNSGPTVHHNKSLNNMSVVKNTTNLFLLLFILKEKGVILWNSLNSLQDILIVNPLEYYFKPMNFLIYEHVSINTEILTELLPAHELSKTHYPEDWQQMIKYGIISHNLLKSLLLSYQHYTKQLIYIFIKFGVIVPVFMPSSSSKTKGSDSYDDYQENQNIPKSTSQESGTDNDEITSYYYLMPALFPLISENKLFSGSFQHFQSNFSFYFYFESENHHRDSAAGNSNPFVDDAGDLPFSPFFHIGEETSPYFSRLPSTASDNDPNNPGSPIRGKALMSELLQWNDLKKNGYLPSGLFELFLTQLIYYSQQTSHDLTFKFSENISLLTPKMKEDYHQKSSKQKSGSNNGRERTTSENNAVEAYYSNQHQQHVLMYSYHHFFYKNQMILQIGNQKFRVTNHPEYNLIQVEVEDCTKGKAITSPGNTHYGEIFYSLQRKLLYFLEFLQKKYSQFKNLNIFTLFLSQITSSGMNSNNASSRRFSLPSEFSSPPPVPPPRKSLSSIFPPMSPPTNEILSSPPPPPLASSPPVSLQITDSPGGSARKNNNVFNKVNDYMIPNYKRKDVLLFDYQLLLSFVQQMTFSSSEVQHGLARSPSFSNSAGRQSFSLANPISAVSSVLTPLSADIQEKYSEIICFLQKKYCSPPPQPLTRTLSRRMSGGSFNVKNGSNGFIGNNEIYEIYITFATGFEMNHSHHQMTGGGVLKSFQNESFSVQEYTEGIVDRFSLYTFPSSSSSSSSSKHVRIYRSDFSTLFDEVKMVQSIANSLIYCPIISEEFLEFLCDPKNNSSEFLEQFLLECLLAVHLLLERQKRRTCSYRLREIIPIVIGKVEENHLHSKQFQFSPLMAKNYLDKMNDNWIPKPLLEKLNAVLSLSVFSLPIIQDYSQFSLKTVFTLLLCSPISASAVGSSSFSFSNNSLVKEPICSWDSMKPFDLSVTFTIKTVERLLVEYREILLLLDDEQEEREKKLIVETEAAKSGFQTPGNSNKLKNNTSNNNNPSNSNNSSSKKNQSGRRSSTSAADQYYYEEFLSPVKSPMKFYSTYVKRILSPLTSPYDSPTKTNSKAEVAGEEENNSQQNSEFDETISTKSSRKGKNTPNAVTFGDWDGLSPEENQLVQEIQKYFKEIQLISSNHNYLMNYFLFSSKKVLPVISKQPSTPFPSPVKENQQPQALVLAEDEDEHNRITELAKAYFTQIKQSSTSNSSYQILFESIPDYYQRVQEIYFELSNYYELLLEICLLNNRSSKKLYALYLQFLQRKSTIQKLMKEILLIYPKNN
jgi:hypothetical protein